MVPINKKNLNDHTGSTDINLFSTEKNTSFENIEKFTIKNFMDDKTIYLGVNLTRDLVEVEARTAEANRYMGGHSYTEIIAMVEHNDIFHQDKEKFRPFFDRDRLMRQFFDGIKTCSLEYRAIEDGKFDWYRAEIQMMLDPTTGEVKAAIVLNNIDEEYKEHERLKTKAQLDPLTEINNRSEAEKQIQEVLDNNSGERCCFLIIDLDDLRIINSDFGHPEGDRALKAISDCMKHKFRKDDIIGRIGGDEFVVLLRNVPEEEQLNAAISGFMNRLNKIQIGPLNNRILRVSIGGATGTAGVDDFETLYKKADLALYYTKAMGKNGFKLYEPELEKRDFTYHPGATPTLNGAELAEPSEFRRFMNAVTLYFPLIISSNLTQNKYCVLEFSGFMTQKENDDGTFDQLIEKGALTFHPEDRENFLRCFKRENLLKAYANGVRIVNHSGRQLGDDGVYRNSHTNTILSEDEETGEIHSISFTHVTPCKPEVIE